MIGAPSVFALSGVRKTAFFLVLTFLLYWLMMGFRYRVGGDWDAYLYMYEYYRKVSPSVLIFEREPGFKLLMWLAARTSLGFISVNLVSAFVFCFGLVAVARQCREPFIAIVVATPLLAIAFGMSAARQALAMGIIFYAYSTWERRTTLSRMALVILATLFHFSALFVLVFVALSARVPMTARLLCAAALGLVIWLVTSYAPASMDSYTNIYLNRGGAYREAPGAIAQVGIIAAAGAVYLLYRAERVNVLGDHILYRSMAIGSLFAIPTILISSVGAYRFSLYFWPMAMYVWAGMPDVIPSPSGRVFYRTIIVSAAVVLLVGWFEFANTSHAWLPYQNWLLQPDGASLRSNR